MAKLLDIHPSALAELKSAISWYLEQNEATANKFVAAVDRAIDLIIESPRRWPAGELETQRFVLQRFPYAIIYQDKESVVTILAVAHGHRQPGYWKDRL
jgi:plasmid stabilization system protein ParE